MSFLPDVNEDVIPHKKSMKEEDVEEERRLVLCWCDKGKEIFTYFISKESYIIKTAGHQDSLWNLKKPAGRKEVQKHGK